MSLKTNQTTIIIPVYNGEQAVVRCLDSIKAQTYKDYSILIINDGSTDNSSAIIDEWKKENPQIVLIHIDQENQGVAAARNKGISLADSEYIAFMDQDDTVSPDYFETYVNAMDSSIADIVCGGYTHRFSSTEGKPRKIQLKNTDWAKFIVVAPWAHLYRTSFLKSHPIRFLDTKLGEDVFFSLMAYAYTDKITVIPNVGYNWINNPVSHSNTKQKSVRGESDPFILLNALDENLPESGYITKTQLEYFYYRYIVWYLLFTARQSHKYDIKKQYLALLTWLNERYPNYRKNKMIAITHRTGELLSIKICVWAFNILDKCHLMLFLLTIL